MKLRNILHSDIITKLLKTIKTIKSKHEKWVSSADIGRELGMQSTHQGTPDTGLATMALHKFLLKRGRPRPRVARDALAVSRPEPRSTLANSFAFRGQQTRREYYRRQARPLRMERNEASKREKQLAAQQPQTRAVVQLLNIPLETV
jgi:hypothetical protein